MLFSLTQASHRWLLISLSGLALNAFAQVQVTSASSGRDFIVAVVDAVPITNHDVNQRLLQLKQQARQQDRASTQASTSLPVVLEKLITEKALLQQQIKALTSTPTH
jgi:parvulin-like peptidyl-prolyl isomerase